MIQSYDDYNQNNDDSNLKSGTMPRRERRGMRWRDIIRGRRLSYVVTPLCLRVLGRRMTHVPRIGYVVLGGLSRMTPFRLAID